MDDYILITGGSGFIGSNFINFLNKKNKYHIVNLDLLTYASNQNNIILKNPEKYTFIHGNICDRSLVHKLFEKYNFKSIVHFAAESHVDNSIFSPSKFIQTNIVGTFNLIDTAKNFWYDSDLKLKKEYSDSVFMHVSTDEVYGSVDTGKYFTEESKYKPNSPYSASKASSDMLVRSFIKTYDFNAVITNCSNNYGPHQNEEKLIPKIIKNAFEGKKIPIYGNGKNIRDWLYVEDHCNALFTILNQKRSKETFLIGGNDEKTNIEIALNICSKLDKISPKKYLHSSLIEYTNDRLGHDFRYAIDFTKINRELGWKPSIKFDEGIEITINWVLNNLR